MADSGNDNSDNSTNVADSGNDSSDNSTNVADSGNDNSDNSTNVADSGNTTVSDSGNDSSDNSTNIADSGNTTISDSGNDSSDNSLALDLDVFLNNADLDGSVSGSSTNYGDANGRASYTDARNRNEISGGSANFTGVGAFAQNAGNGNVTQANVSVMSNLSTGGGTQ